MNNPKRAPRYRSMRYHVIRELDQHLDQDLWYHGIHHTRDVLKVCNNYIRREGLSDDDALLLRTAAILHDYGFLKTYKDHENAGCETARAILPAYYYSEKMVEEICGLIMATKIPQSPRTQLEMIICDADLDYLGRQDFKEIGETLYKELQAVSGLNSRVEWNKIQYNFLKEHTYFTDFAKRRRAPQKAKNLKEIQEWLEHHAPDYLTE